MLSNIQEKNWLKDILLLCLLIGAAYTFLLGHRPLNVPDEARYCEIPREMLVTGDFITPHLNGIKYFEKPALFYWMQAGALKLFGLNEWACRITDALIALLGCLGTYIASRLLFNRRTAWFASITLASSLLYFTLARVVTLDMTVSIFITLSLFSFIAGTQYSPGWQRRLCFYLLYFFAALAVLTKGLIGVIFPAAIIFLWLVITRRWRELRYSYIFSGALLFFVVAAPWHFLVQRANPEFFRFYFLDQQFVRYLTKEEHRYQPPWYYLPILLLGLFPWTGFLYGAIKKLNVKNHNNMFFIIWAIFIFVFFSFSDSKLVPYILPVFPPVAILLGNYFATQEERQKSMGLWIGFIFSSIVALAIAVIAPHFLTPAVTTNFVMARYWTKATVVLLVIIAVIVPWLFWRQGFLSAYVAQAGGSLLFYFMLCATAPYIYMDSVKPLALEIKHLIKINDMVATYDYYYQDLPFYLQRLVTIVNWQGELTFGEQHQPTGEMWITDSTFWQVWQSDRTVYMMLARDMLQRLQQRMPYHFYIVALGKNDVVVVNHPLISETT